MPFGLQVIGPNGADAQVLEAAHALEQVLAADKETARPVPPSSLSQRNADLASHSNSAGRGPG
jgi:hypothetical protein